MRYRYSAIDRQGKKVQGYLDSPSPRAARLSLQTRNLQIMTLKEVSVITTSSRFSSRGRALRGNDFVLITRQLATLLGASLPLEDALQALAQQCEKPAHRQIIQDVRQQVLEGLSFSDALEKHSRTFNTFFRALVAAGESSGKLSQVLARLADHAEQSQKITSKITQALIYPLMLTLVAVGVIAILLTSVVPKVVEQFAYLQSELPLTTRVLMAMSDGIKAGGGGFLLTCGVVGLLMKYLLKKPHYRQRWDGGCLRIPLLGKMILNLNMARYAKTLNILSASAVPLLEAMHLSNSVVTNQHARALLMMAEASVKEGSDLSGALTQSGLLSPMMRHMIASGERSGELDRMLGHAADIQEQAFLHQITTLVGVFTPLLVITMAGIVFFIVLAILQPIMQLNSLMG
ncbi:type II secretion system protein GspF [Erwinia psidii]|uniref:type II secretion system inner membrane protein GspF n=1 Tax=Erwinia psidii TaxID=69224 RepID=UPI00226B7970|nr:type II secretion system inner membrane protein GspF [Erwinia psidii]MCX8962480.1 type II secretion system protein GspF [Erwinia psidii]